MAPREEAWDFPAPRLRTPRGVVHVWRASSDPPARRLESLLRILSGAERSRAAQFCFERDRRWFIAGRGVVRMILGSYLTIPPDRLQFRPGGTGKPAGRPTVDGDPGASSRWWLRDLAPAPGYVAALANDGDQVLPMTCVQWPEWL
jgi:hypothetical protein